MVLLISTVELMDIANGDVISNKDYMGEITVIGIAIINTNTNGAFTYNRFGC